MEVRAIKTESDYRSALAIIDRLFDAPENSPEADELDVLATLVEAYEQKHYPIEPPEPIEMLIHYMEAKGLTRADLETAIGSRARVSEVLNRRRPLTIQMIRRLQSQFGMSADLLIRPYPLVPSAGGSKAAKRLAKPKVIATKPGR